MAQTVKKSTCDTGDPEGQEEPLEEGMATHSNILAWRIPWTMRNAGLEEAQAGIKIARRNINNLRYADDTILMAESEEELKPLDESERRE